MCFVVYILYLTSFQYKTKILTPNSLDKPTSTMHTFLICTIKYHKAHLYLLYPLATCTIVLIDTKNFTKFSNFRNSLETQEKGHETYSLLHFFLQNLACFLLILVQNLQVQLNYAIIS